MRLLRRLAIGLVAAVAAVFLLGVLGTVIPYPFVYDAKDGAAPRQRILVVSNAIHTDLAIPLDDVSLAAFGFLDGTGLPIRHPDVRWLLFGWGGRSFYLETPSLSDIKPGPTFRALTIDTSVMHVDVLGAIEESDPAVTAIDVSQAAYANLLATISADFSRRDGRIEPIEGFAFGTSDRFFEAEGRFNALVGCNVWTARMLRSAGIRTGIWDPLPFALTTSLHLFNPLPG